MYKADSNRNRIATILLFLFSPFFQATASPFSIFNRYELSYEAIAQARDHMGDTLPTLWFSHLSNKRDVEFPLQWAIKEQRFDFDAGVLTCYERSSSSNRFGVLSGDVAFSSPVVNAFISADVYSTENRCSSPISDIRYERFIKSGSDNPISGVFDFRFNLPEAYLESTVKFITLSTGKQKLRWGPGYKGTLGLSGTAYSPFYFYHLKFLFGTILNISAFLCGYDDEASYRQELSMAETAIVKNNNVRLISYPPRYCSGQRLDIRLGRHLQIGLYELVDFFGTNELNRFANPLQIYYLADEAGGTNNANLLGGFDLNIVFNPFRFYGEFLDDDLTFFDNAGNPDKYAFQLGGVFYGKKPLLSAGAEYTHLSKYVYGHYRVLSRHAHWGESMGWPWGNDQDLFTAYALFSLPYNINGKLEGNLWIKGDGTIEDDWYADGRPDLDHAPYWPENSTTIFSAIVSAEHSPLSWLTYCCYWEPMFHDKKMSNGFFGYLKLSIPGSHKIKVL